MERDFGRTLDIDNKYYLWDAKFPTWRDQYDVESGRIPMFSWGGGDTIQIQKGKYDALIDERAAALKAFGATFFLRWFWEADGTRASKAKVSHSAADYVKAWRYVRDRFDRAGVTNAVWVWCPVSLNFYPPPRGLNPAQPYYPGDDVVDWICADGYNWAPGKKGTPYQSFQSLFEAFYAFGNEHSKPMMIGETGVQENNPGDKANWIAAMHQSVIQHYPNIVAFLYFDVDDSGATNYDWRLNSSSGAMGAFKDMALDPYFNQPHATLAP
jgi:beta-mannanase